MNDIWAYQSTIVLDWHQTPQRFFPSDEEHREIEATTLKENKSLSIGNTWTAHQVDLI